MKKTKKAIASLAIAGLVLSAAPLSVFGATADQTRLFGADRFATAIQVAEAGWTSADVAIVAPAADQNLVDALAASSLAGQEHAPILLTENDKLTEATKAELVKLGVKKVFVVGAISDAVAAEIDALDAVSVEVLKGADRVETAQKINAKLANPAGSFVVGYGALADALSVASYAAANNYGIVVANPDGSVPTNSLVGATKYVVGGPTLVADVAGAARVYGQDRFETNSKVVEKFGADYKYNKVYVANGEDAHLVDSLVASSLAAKTTSPVLLTNGTSVNAGSFVSGKMTSADKSIALGGTSVVSDSVVASVGSSVFGDVRNVAATTTVVDSDATGSQYLKFTINDGNAASYNDLEDNGYTVTFVADAAVLATADGAALENHNGKLDNAALADVDSFKYHVEIQKGSDVVSSLDVEVNVEDMKAMTSEISGYTLKANDVELKSNTISTYDAGVSISKIEATLSSGAKYQTVLSADGNIEFKSSDLTVATVDKDGTIYPVSAGTVTITATYGASKAITLKVVDEEREATKATADFTSLKLVKGATRDVVFTVVDQFGDPVEDADFDVANYDVQAKTSSGAIVANATQSTTEEPTSYANKGKTIVTVTATSTAGDGSMVIVDKDNDNKVLASYKVAVGDNGVFGDNKIELADPTKDLTIDTNKSASVTGEPNFYGNKDKTVTLNYNEYNSNGYYRGTATVDYVWASADPEIATVDETTGVVTAVATGTVKIFARVDGVDRDYVTVTVVNTTPKVTTVAFESDLVMNEAAGVLEVDGDIFKSLTSAIAYDNKGGDNIVRQALDTETGNVNLYLDCDNDQAFDSTKDILLGHLELAFSVKDADGNNAADHYAFTEGTNGIELGAPVAGDKGNLVVKFVKRGTTAAFKTVIITVNVDK